MCLTIITAENDFFWLKILAKYVWKRAVTLFINVFASVRKFSITINIIMCFAKSASCKRMHSMESRPFFSYGS